MFNEYRMKHNTDKTMKHKYPDLICILLHFFSEQRTAVTDQTYLYGGLFAGGAFIVVMTIVGIACMMKRRNTSRYKNNVLDLHSFRFIARMVWCIKIRENSKRDSIKLMGVF